MEFKEFYKQFVAGVKKELSAALWDKARSKGDPSGFAKELYDNEFSAEEAAEEFVEMVNVMKEQGEFDEAHECEWVVEYKDIWDNEETEKFKDEHKAWSRYNELDSRTVGDMADILWVKEPTCPACEDGSSAASLGVAPNAAKRDEGFTKDDIDAFTIDDSNYIDHALLGDDNSIVIKVAKEPSTREFKLVAMLQGADARPETKTIKAGGLINVVDFYRELLDMPMENAITLVEGA